MWRAEGNIILKILISKPTGKYPRGRPRQRWQDRVNVDIRMIVRTSNIETTANQNV